MYSNISLWFDMASNFGVYENLARARPTGIQNHLYEESSSSSDSLMQRAIRKVYVGNVSSRTNVRDLRSCFSTFGQVQNAHFAKLRTGVRPNYGFVTYFRPEDAATAINVGQDGNIFLHGRRLVVNEADLKYQPQVLPNGRILWTPRMSQTVWSANREPADEIDESKCVIHLLNDDCLRLIFSLLPKRDLIKSERVCKRWQAVSRGMWLSTKVLTFSNLGIRRSPLSMHIVTQLFERCGKNLVNVDLSFKPSDLSPGVLFIVAESCPNLDTINLCSVPLTMSGLKAVGRKCPELRHVNLERCFGVQDRDIQKFFFLCKKLETVVLSHNTVLTGRCLEGLNKESIRSIELNECSGLRSDIINKCISSFTNLHNLDIDQCINLTSKDLNVLFNALPQLTSLSMRQYYPNVSHLTFKSLAQLRELVSLNVSQNNSITDEVLEAIAKGCKKLKTLDISGCSIHAENTVTDKGIAAIAKLPRLTTLKMSYMALTSDLALVAIAENAPKLQKLECRGCASFHNFGCSRMVTLCNELRLFDFSGCDEVSQETVDAANAAVKLRTNNVPLKLIVGGTLINDPCNIDMASNLLQVDFQDLCSSHLRPDFVDNHYFLSDSDEDDDFEDLYDVDFDVVGSPAMFFGDDIGEYYGYLAFMGGRDFNNSDFEFDDESDLE